jgi:sulfopyruvate decarboxylase subunit alpha
VKPHLARLVMEGLKRAQVRVVSALPDTLLKGVYEACAADPEIRYIPVTNEAEGAAIAAGAYAGGRRSVLVMENSGLRVACEALARIGLVNTFPVVILMGYRGDVGERWHWGVNHGVTMEPLLQALRIPCLMVDREDAIVSSVERAVVHGVNSQYHCAVVFRYPLVEDDRMARPAP